MTEPNVRFARLPVDDRWPITGRFGDVYRDGSREWTHLGVDFGCPTGTPVYAPAPGRVIRPNNDGSFGVAVAVEHSDGWITLYAHLSRADVWPGDEVQVGQQLGLSGATGFVTGPHLHWQMCDTWLFPRDPARSRDPLLYIEQEDPEMNARLERLERLVLMIGELLVGDSSGRQFVSLDELEPVLERHRANQTRFADGLGGVERELIQHRHSPVDGSVIWSGRF